MRVAVPQALKEQLAIVAGLNRAEAASKVQLDVRAARRRLLAGTVAVDATINLPDAAAATKAKSQLTTDAINAAVKAAGLPPATITKMPATAGFSGAARSVGASAGMMAAAAFLAAAVSAL